MRADIIIIGGGMAGLSAAFFLSSSASVILMEREAVFGSQSSARSAGQFTVGIAADTMRRLGQASRAFLENPPEGFAPYPLLSKRGCLTVGREDQKGRLETLHGHLTEVGAEARYVDRREALALFPALRGNGVDGGVYEPDAMDIDVDLLLQGYARGAKSRGAQLLTGVDISSIRREAGEWIVGAGDLRVSAPLLLNASGAWVDEVTDMAGLERIGLTPHKRTAFTFAQPAEVDTSAWPHVSHLDYKWYVKPEAKVLMGSLVDAVPTLPGEVYPEDIDVAQAIHNISEDTTFEISRPISTWAGLRNFVRDRNPVCGTRPDAEGFFWLAGHGGCGILTSPALGEAIAAVMLGRELPDAQRALGIAVADLAPDRKSLVD